MEANRYMPYSLSDKQFILDNHQKLSDKELGDKIGRSYDAIINIKRKLKIPTRTRLYMPHVVLRAKNELSLMRATFLIHADMKALIILCELEKNIYKKDKYKKELENLDKIKNNKLTMTKYHRHA